MRLCIKNLGKIETANIEIDAITVIAGENNTGKSTVGKALFCVFNSLYKIGEQIENERVAFISDRLLSRDVNTSGLAEFIVENKNKYKNDKDLLKQELADQLMLKKTSPRDLELFDLDMTADGIIRFLGVSDDEVLTKILRRKMLAEFNMQVNNLHCPEKDSEIILKIKQSEVNVRVTSNENIDITNTVSLNTEVIYIDDPYTVDNLRVYRYQYVGLTHREHLCSYLLREKTSSSIREALDEIIAAKKFDKVYNKLNTICPGELVRKNKFAFAYRENDSNLFIDVRNLSTGLKAFMIIKTLLLNGCLEEKGTIILDEPEKHLHPKWQIVFAELIVLIQKEFNMHVLINTHSPYFLDAVETFSHKHGIALRCKYYLAEDHGTTATIVDVSDSIEKIYQKLSKPLQDLENTRYADD